MSNLFRFINCHQCSKIDESKNMVICSKEDCKESFCLKCIKKFYVFIKSKISQKITKHTINSIFKTKKIGFVMSVKINVYANSVDLQIR